MADTAFRRKLLGLQFRTGHAAPKQTVDHHDYGRVIVTERTDHEGDHQDVHVMPDAHRIKLSQEAP